MTFEDHALIEQLRTKGVLSDTDVRLIKELANLYPELMLTGSALWGAATPADIDLLCATGIHEVPYGCPDHLGRADIGARKLSVKRTYNGGSLNSLTFEGCKVNLICLDDNGYQLWSRATRMMCELPYIPDKATRVGVFETLRSVARIALGYTFGTDIKLG